MPASEWSSLILSHSPAPPSRKSLSSDQKRAWIMRRTFKQSPFNEYGDIGRDATPQICLHLACNKKDFSHASELCLNSSRLDGWPMSPKEGKSNPLRAQTDSPLDSILERINRPMEQKIPSRGGRALLQHASSDLSLKCSLITDQGRVEYKAGHPLYLLPTASSSRSRLHSESLRTQ